MNPQLKQTLNSIIQHAEMGVLGAQTKRGCAYHSANTFCAIGCLLTSEQLQEIDNLNQNAGTSIYIIMEESPEIKQHLNTLGIGNSIAAFLQHTHDSTYTAKDKSEQHKKELDKKFIGSVKRIINTGEWSDYE